MLPIQVYLYLCPPSLHSVLAAQATISISIQVCPSLMTRQKCHRESQIPVRSHPMPPGEVYECGDEAEGTGGGR